MDQKLTRIVTGSNGVRYRFSPTEGVSREWIDIEGRGYWGHLPEDDEAEAYRALLRGRTLEDVGGDETQLEGYQHFLARVADAAGVPGSPNLDEVLAKVTRLCKGVA